MSEKHGGKRFCSVCKSGQSARFGQIWRGGEYCYQIAYGSMEGKIFVMKIIEDFDWQFIPRHGYVFKLKEECQACLDELLNLYDEERLKETLFGRWVKMFKKD